MVLIIKSIECDEKTTDVQKLINENKDLEKICKQMINITFNRLIFDEYGKYINKETPFNVYEISNIIFNCNVMSGTIVFYNAITNISNILETIFTNIVLTYNIDITCDNMISCKFNFNTTYVNIFEKSVKKIQLILSTVNGKAKKITQQTFIWIIVNGNKTFLDVLTKSDIYPSTEYLNNSISTIIYDNKNLIAIPNNVVYKHIDYPNFDQFTMCKNNQVLETFIYISNKFGLSHEITQHYFSIDPILKFDNQIKNNTYSNNKKFDHKELTTCKTISYVNNVKWQENIFNKSTSNHTMNCFISGMPLYESALLCHILFNNSDNNSDEKQETPDVSYILLSINLVYKYNFNQLLQLLKDNGISLIKVFITDINKTEADAILEIPDNKISTMKKNIMYCISYYGFKIDSCHNIYNKTLYTFDLKNNQIYVGIKNALTDIDLIQYTNTNTILFCY